MIYTSINTTQILTVEFYLKRVFVRVFKSRTCVIDISNKDNVKFRYIYICLEPNFIKIIIFNNIIFVFA